MRTPRQATAAEGHSATSMNGAIFREKNWTVRKHEVYNIRGHTGHP